MIDYKKRIETIVGSAAIIIGGTAIVLGLAGQIYLNKSLQQQSSSMSESYSTSESYQQWLDAFDRQMEFEELAFEKGGVIEAYIEIARRRGLVERVE